MVYIDTNDFRNKIKIKVVTALTECVSSEQWEMNV